MFYVWTENREKNEVYLHYLEEDDTVPAYEKTSRSLLESLKVTKETVPDEFRDECQKIPDCRIVSLMEYWTKDMDREMMIFWVQTTENHFAMYKR